MNIEPKALLTKLSGLKLTRYGLVFGSGVLCGSWAAIQWPEWNAAFWAMPATSLMLAIVGLVLSQRKTDANAAALEKALYSAPDGMKLVEKCDAVESPK